MTGLEKTLERANEKLTAKDFSYLSGKLDGLSENQLNQHFTLYNGYVNKINEIWEKLKNVDLSTANPTYSDLRELQIEQSFALNGVILHEKYFSNLTDKATVPSDELKSFIDRDFGSWDAYVTNLKAVSKSARGWAFTGYCFSDGRIHNFVSDTHNMFLPMGVMPLLVIDVYEHAYMIDWGINRAGYIDALFNHINWEMVSERFNQINSCCQGR